MVIKVLHHGVLQQVNQMSNGCERLVTEGGRGERGGEGSFISLNLCYG